MYNHLVEVIKLRKVELTMDENYKYKIIKKLVDTNGNKRRASIKLGISIRQINRLICAYKKKGKAAFVHGNKGKKPINAFNDQFKDDLALLYSSRYSSFNIRHFCEKLNEMEIRISESTVRKILAEKEILSPMCQRKTKQALKRKLKAKLKSAKTEKEKLKIKEKILIANDPHPRREKCKYPGEMIQLDASEHLWFGEHKTFLHAAIDDTTGTIVGAYFDYQETLKGYYKTFHQILSNYGIPNMFYTDRRTIFEYKKLNSKDIEKDTFTQFSYACEQLGVDIKCTSVSQAKGKVERLFRTLQSRLLNELKLAGVTTIKEANLFLLNYLPKFNKKFALPINSNKSVFESSPNEENINLILAVLAERKVDEGHCIKYKKRYYKIINESNKEIYFKKGTEAIVAKTLDENLYVNINSKTYVLEELNDYEIESKYFKPTKTEAKSNEQPKRRYIPPMDHPWRKKRVGKFIRQHEQEAA